MSRASRAEEPPNTVKVRKEGVATSKTPENGCSRWTQFCDCNESLPMPPLCSGPSTGTPPDTLTDPLTDREVEFIRRDFPGLDAVVHGEPLAYLDSGARGTRPRP